ncbi:unnamed protein product [Rhodiola kirilowii]
MQTSLMCEIFHEVKDEGYEIDHDGKLVTLFSAPNYCAQMGNKGVFILFEAPELKPTITTFSAVVRRILQDQFQVVFYQSLEHLSRQYPKQNNVGTHDVIPSSAIAYSGGLPTP